MAPRYTPEDTFLGTLMGALLQTERGTNTIFDDCHNDATSARSDAAFDALFESRIRADPDSPGAAYERRNLQTLGTGGSMIETVSGRTRVALETANLGNARAPRLDHHSGSLTPGKPVDVAIIRRDTLDLLCAHDPLQAVVFYAQSRDVDAVFVAVRRVKSRGEVVEGALGRRTAEFKASAARLVDVGA